MSRNSSHKIPNINLLHQHNHNFLKFAFKEVVENLGWVGTSFLNAVLGAQAGLFAVQHGPSLTVVLSKHDEEDVFPHNGTSEAGETSCRLQTDASQRRGFVAWGN